MKRPLLLAVLLGLAIPAHAQEAEAGLSLYDKPKYGGDFTHFDYVNPDAPKGGKLRLGAMGTFDTLNPFTLEGVAAGGAGLVFDTLMVGSLDEPFSEYGEVAKTATIAPDRSWVVFDLRPEARFSDGSKITPEDVIFSFETLRDKGSPVFRSFYKDVTKVEKTGPSQVKFTFRDGTNRELPLDVGQLSVLSKKYWEGKDFSATTLTPVVGSGPYTIDNVDGGRSVTYKRVKDWWAKDLPINRGRYNFDEVSYDYYRDTTVLLEAFFAGRYDFREENVAKNWAQGYDSQPAVQHDLIKRDVIKNELPAGMQGFIFNTRRPIFQDRLVREALGYAFDFEWSNKNMAFGAYTRSNSYFSNSELAASGLPSADEVKLLEPFRGKIPDDVFTQEIKLPATDGSGNNRDNLHKAADLLKQAGWILKGGTLVNAKGEPFTFEIISNETMFERWLDPMLRNFERLGIHATFRVVDSAQMQDRMNDFNFDMTISTIPASLTPGNGELTFFSSNQADVRGSNNVMGIKNPAVDALLDKLIHAQTRAELVTICHALDRVLMQEYYLIPNWYIGSYRVAYWDMFGRPTTSPPYGLPVEDTWWVDAAKAPKIMAAQKRGP